MRHNQIDIFSYDDSDHYKEPSDTEEIAHQLCTLVEVLLNGHLRSVKGEIHTVTNSAENF